MSKPRAPEPPNYAAAATAQGAANKDAALASGQLSNPNVKNPYGEQRVTYTNDPTTGNPVPNVTQTFAPGQQQIFENEQALQQKLGFLGIGAADMAGKTISQPLDFNSRFGTQGQGRQEVIDAMMGRYDQDAARQKDSINSELVARGIPQGSKAYESQMDRLIRGRNDALQQATIAADTKALDERRQGITEALAERQVPMNEVSAMRSGSQIQPLTFSNVSGQSVQPAPMFGATNAQYGAAMDQYGANVGAYNNTMGGLFGLGAASLMAPKGTFPAMAAAFSDRRLKSNVVRIGTHPLGIGIYEYNISGRREIGVMADEGRARKAGCGSGARERIQDGELRTPPLMAENFKSTAEFAEALTYLKFTKEQALYLRDLIGATEAQIGVITDALYVLNQMLTDGEHGTRATYLMMVAQELRTRLANARIEAGRYQQESAAAYRVEALH
jgi:hypothetical protein